MFGNDFVQTQDNVLAHNFESVISMNTINKICNKSLTCEAFLDATETYN